MVLNETDKVMILKNLKRINELVTGFNSSFISTVVSGGYHRSQPLHIRTVVPLCEGIDFLNVHAYMDFLIKEGSKNLIFRKNYFKTFIPLFAIFVLLKPFCLYKICDFFKISLSP